MKNRNIGFPFFELSTGYLQPGKYQVDAIVKIAELTRTQKGVVPQLLPTYRKNEIINLKAKNNIVGYRVIYYGNISVFNEENYRKVRCMSVDLAGNGGDLCVASLIESKSTTQWSLEKQEHWSEPDTDVTKGRIINLYSLWKPELLILDADGLGYSIYVSIKNVISNAIKFNGAASSNRPNALNRRADGYLTLKDFIDNEWLKISSDFTISQLEYIKKCVEKK